MHKFPSDFYDSHLKVCILGYLRAEKNFTSLGECRDINITSPLSTYRLAVTVRIMMC